ncbi:MAG: hypothetical protein LBE91_08270 [Tannerella sp.]|jgi:hypothetical protein|nr:hypothetical protein [Tannerella sp.]
MESFETERLSKLIAFKKQDLKKEKNGYRQKLLQREITLLENEIMPILYRETVTQDREIASFAVKCYRAANVTGCNGVLFYIPLSSEYDDSPVLGIVNPNEYKPWGEPGAATVIPTNVEVINLDPSGMEGVEFTPIIINIDNAMLEWDEKKQKMMSEIIRKTENDEHQPKRTVGSFFTEGRYLQPMEDRPDKETQNVCSAYQD